MIVRSLSFQVLAEIDRSVDSEAQYIISCWSCFWSSSCNQYYFLLTLHIEAH